MERAKPAAQTVHTNRNLPAALGGFALACLLAQSRALGLVSPFALALVASVPSGTLLLTASGAALGYALVLEGPTAILRSVIAVIAAAMLRAFGSRTLPQRLQTLASGAIAFVCSAATAFTVLLSQNFPLGSVLQYTSEALLSGGAAWFFSQTLTAVQAGGLFTRHKRTELAGLVIFGCVLLSSLGELVIWNVTPAQILGAFCLLCAAQTTRETGGSIAGISIGIALYAANPSGSLLAVFCIGGLLTGLCAPLGQLVSAAVFSFICAVAALADGSAESVALLFETAAAAAVFVALPKQWFRAAADRLSPRDAAPAKDAAVPDASARLIAASRAVSEVNRCVMQVAEGLEQEGAAQSHPKWTDLQNKVCRGCEGFDYCWGENKAAMAQGLKQVLYELRAQGHVLPESFPPEFRSSCPRTAELSVAANRLQLEHNAKRSAYLRSVQLREVVTEQFDATAELLRDMAGQLQEEENEPAQPISYLFRLGSAQRTPETQTLCGDYYACSQDEQGHAVCVLSDGMGTGGRAAVDSTMATELFLKLTQAGLRFENALHFVNSALLIKSPEESLATLDILSINLRSGRTDFFKAGAAASLLRRKGRVFLQEQPSLPAGILRSIRFAHSSTVLGAGDIVLLVSDGAIPEDSRALLQLLRNWEGDDMNALAGQAADFARQNGQADDITVIAGMLVAAEAK